MHRSNRPPSGSHSARWYVCALLILLNLAPAQAFVDVDGDGWGDVWEAAYGRGYDPNADDDHDGRTNWEEHNDGTDPRDPQSVRPVPQVTEKPRGTFLVQWPTIAGKQYQLQLAVNGGEWVNLGVPYLGTGSSIELKLPGKTTYSSGGALQSRWLNFNGNLAAVKAKVSGNVAPDVAAVLPVVETPQTNPDLDSYGQWIRGWIMPPATGKYTFWIASDDSSELWLSNTSDPAGKKLIASVSGYTNFREWTKYPTQVSVPVSLTINKPVYFEIFHQEGYGGDHVSVAWTGPKLAVDKEILAGKYVLLDPLTLAQKLAAGTPAWRVVVSDVDSDGDGVTDYEEAIAGLDPFSAKSVPKENDLDSLKAMLASPNTVTVGAEIARAYEREGTACRFTFARSGNLGPLRIHYAASGVAVEGQDFPSLKGYVDLGAGQNSVSIDLVPTNDGVLESAESLTVTVEPGDGYLVGEPSSATATIDDAADQIYIANLVADPSVKTGGYGTAALRVAGNNVFATFGLSFSNLTATQLGTEVYILGAGNRPTVVWTLGAGQIQQQRWDFDSTNGVTKAAILDALKKGKLLTRLKTARFPVSEISGKFVQQVGSKLPPKAPSAGPTLTRARDDGEAARFLTQASFGPTVEDIAKVKKLGYSGWIADQLKQPATLHLPYVHARRLELQARNPLDDGWQTPRQEAWWQAALTAPDQLRQRMAFALSEIFVVSDIGTLEGSHEGITNYYDDLVRGAFGNFRDLLEQVTLSPIMGQYLSMVQNQKPNPDTGSEPDENYAREVMQLFTIGLNMLNPDGSLQLDANGMPIPTYTQNDIIGLAHVFTGWGYAYDTANPPADLNSFFFYGGKNELKRMVMYPNFHDPKAKQIVHGVAVPAGQTGEQDLKLALDTLANHPNVGPFLSRQLIQRLVTSNPSRGYVGRVAAVFKSSRGNLGSTLRAILLDAEARNPPQPLGQAYGKLREPLLRMSHLLRATRAMPPLPNEPRYFLDLEYAMPTQVALKSGSVFNFFQPSFTQPGPIAQAGLVAPEFQITAETTVIAQSNAEHAALFYNIYTREQDANGNGAYIQLNNQPEIDILNAAGGTALQNQAKLLDHLDALFCNGRMSPGLRAAVTNAWAALPGWYGTSFDQQNGRVRIAIYIITASPDYCVQK